MKRVNKTRLLVLLLLLAAYGCTQTDVEGYKTPPHALQEVDAGFTLNVVANRIPVTRSLLFTTNGATDTDTLATGVNDTIRTKAAAPLAEAQETAIDNLWVGQYDAATGQCLFNQYLPSIVGTTVNLKLKQSQDGSRSRVYFVSNAGDLGAISDEMTLKGHKLDYVSTDEGLPDNNLCRMMGTWEGVVSENGVKDIPVSLTRLLAKITFTYSIPTDAGFAFTPTSVVLRNVPTVSQVEPPAGQLPDIVYRAYTTTGSTGTIYWYLPENMAGTAVGDAAVDSEKKKTGRGVTNATCIELTGIAVQGGVTYTDVTFRFYPGSNHNNYDIVRNFHYKMNIMLLGIDISDERITVGEIPPVEVSPGELPAEKGGRKEVRITARPGQAWKLDMPAWLSALLDGKEVSSGATISHQGPASMVFIANSTNPVVEKRSVTLGVGVSGENQEQKIEIIQSGSVLVIGNDISLAASRGSVGTSFFTATEGLRWQAILSDDWLNWADASSDGETSGKEQALTVKVSATNPLAANRSGRITVTAGASVGDSSYDGLKQIISVGQAGATVTGSVVNNIAAKGASAEASFTATEGLDWQAGVASGDWLTLTSDTWGSPTTGSAQKINFTLAVNPSSAARDAEIVVRAGDINAGPTGKISVNQLGASLSVSGGGGMEATAFTGRISFMATGGLSWGVSVRPADDWLTFSEATAGTTGDSSHEIVYNAAVNPNSSIREGEVTVKVGDALEATDAGLTKTVGVTQEGSVFTVFPTTINLESTAASGTVTVNGTKGLSCRITPAGEISGISPETTSFLTDGTDQLLMFGATENPGSTRSAEFTIAVNGGDHFETVKVKQATSLTGLLITINQSVLTSYRTKTTDMAVFPPFSSGGTNEYHGCTVNETAGTMTGSYTIQVQTGQRDDYAGFLTVRDYCFDLNEEGSGWRAPTQIELHAMYINKDAIEGSSGVSPFANYGYWSSSLSNGSNYTRTKVDFSNGNFQTQPQNFKNSIRCVRDY